MSILTWDKPGERRFETGTDRGVLYPLTRGRYGKGAAWNGLTAVNENPTGAEATPLYADNIKYLNLLSAEDFGATIEAYTYPEEFDECMGEAYLARGVKLRQQKRKHFGFCYRTKIGNDQDGSDAGYKIHLLFDCVASPSDSSYSTTNDSPEAITYSFEISTTPVAAEGYKPTSSLVLDSEKFRKSGLANVLAHIEDVLYGTENEDPAFLKIPDILEIQELEMYVRDDRNNELLDSSGHKIRSRVFS